MKRINFALVMAMLSITLFSCSKDNGEEDNQTIVEEFSRKFFSAEKAEFRNEALPQPTVSQPIQATMNERVLAGGQNFITISSPVELAKVNVSMDGQEGYWEIPVTPITRADVYSYRFVLDMGTELAQDVSLQISGVTPNGDITPAVKCEVKYVESLSGDLAINLTFSNEKDVDLHVVTPYGYHIFYRDRGLTDRAAMEEKMQQMREDPDFNWEDFDSDEFEAQFLMFGLDHDSNAGCSIDKLNNENIVFNEKYVCDGKYTIYLDMYENCDFNSDPTSWGVAVRYQGNLVNSGISVGSNPANGVFPANEPSNYGSDDVNKLKYKVIEFELTGTGKTADEVAKAIEEIKNPTEEKMYSPARLSSMPDRKLELSKTMHMSK